MTDSTCLCPHCGGAIRLVPGAIDDAIPTQSSAQSVTQSKVAHGSEVQDRKPSTKERRAYNQGYDQEFLEFWSVYPLRRDKRKAQTAWRNAVARLGATADARAGVIAGAIRYRDDPNRVEAFTKYAEGWLNADGWEDEPLPFRLKPQDMRRPDPPRPLTSGEMRQATEWAMEDGNG